MKEIITNLFRLKSKKDPEKEEMRSLIDGAYDIIFDYAPVTPAQIVWRKEWLKNSKKFGAGLDC